MCVCVCVCTCMCFMCVCVCVLRMSDKLGRCHAHVYELSQGWCVCRSRESLQSYTLHHARARHVRPHICAQLCKICCCCGSNFEVFVGFYECTLEHICIGLCVHSLHLCIVASTPMKQAPALLECCHCCFFVRSASSRQGRRHIPATIFVLY